MQTKIIEIPVRQLVEGYRDNAENGVVGYGGNLNIRPPYQREFVYKEVQRNAVIRTVMNGHPLSLMYWSDNGDGRYEVIDGQQRTLSICQYVNGDFSFEGKYYHNLQPDEREKVLGYSLLVCLCTGTPSEKLEWFRTINIAGVALTEQELRNATYHGTWLEDAKRYFSRNGCVAYKLASDYMNGSPIRQDYLEKTLDWISDGRIEEYMATHQNDPSAAKLWGYFSAVVTWIETTFPKKRAKIMKGVDWGVLYNQYGEADYDPAFLESRIKELLIDDDVTNKKGIYPYLITGKEKYLSLRAFTDGMKVAAYERQDGICPVCGERYDIGNMEGDHITPWSKGGKTVAENCQMLCRECNRRKGGI